MPIESAIIKKNKLNLHAMSIPEFRSACEQFAKDFVNRQRDEFIRLGVLADWENPYCTMDKSFEQDRLVALLTLRFTLVFVSSWLLGISTTQFSSITQSCPTLCNPVD